MLGFDSDLSVMERFTNPHSFLLKSKAMASDSTYWLGDDGSDAPITCVCFGTGRFLRSVLVPIMNSSYHRPPVLVQTRGLSFLDTITSTENTGNDALRKHYPVDTVNYDGTVTTDLYAVSGAFSLGTDASKKAVFDLLLRRCSQHLQILGMGVTEKGLSDPNTPVMLHLSAFLKGVSKQYQIHGNTQTIHCLNTDNVPRNGSVIRSHMFHHAQDDASFRDFLKSRVIFHTTMVDRIVAHRADDPFVPRAEPFPAKALVVLDEYNELKSKLSTNIPWLVHRSTSQQLDVDIALKLQIANGTHTALACAMAVCGITNTDQLLKEELSILLDYVDSWVDSQVLTTIDEKDEASAVWADWRRRLTHPHFGLSTLFITQNSATKGGIRFGPTVRALLSDSATITTTTAFAYAALLRFLTPSRTCGAVYRGWFADRKEVQKETVVYADGLTYNLAEGWYEFRCEDAVAGTLQDKKEGLQATIATYLTGPGQLPHAPETFVRGIATLYERMIAGDSPLRLLRELKEVQGFHANVSSLACSSIPQFGGPLHYRTSPIPDDSCLMDVPIPASHMSDVVADEVAHARIIDLHTHLLPPSHGPSLCLWGIDELLTYHYLVAEYFMTAPASMTPEVFYPKSKQEQADLVWKALFIDRLPLSEAARGVGTFQGNLPYSPLTACPVTTLQAFGLDNLVRTRDLDAIRVWYRRFRETSEGAEEFSKMVHDLSGVQYNVMTNVPFNPEETQHWRDKKTHSGHYRTAVRVDPLLSGDRVTLETTLRASGFDNSIEGARQFLRYWIDTLQPEYVMASTPHDFRLPEQGYNLEAMNTPGAFAQAIASEVDQCGPSTDETPTQIDESCDLLSEVLMYVCQERDLPVALKIGAHRQVNPRLQQAGDGIVSFADANMLARLCTRFPKVRFLATFLSRNNQQEACVLASKFSNLHIYGCWWYCFTPSIMEEITKMRFEMLGTAFTAQHSDARVVDQLVYKWAHSRSVVANVMTAELEKLSTSGWSITRREVRRDVGRILGGSYQAFLEKKLTEEN